MTSNGLCIGVAGNHTMQSPLLVILGLYPGSAALPVSRFDSPPIAVPPGGLLVPEGPTNNCGAITVACATPAPAKTASDAARAALARIDEDLVFDMLPVFL